ncbi:hypothetical protein E2C01_035387 [Portunus trituberculatus]|uniref:Uncharacterized protein n=1 Tax=Portunus trituberculatus TaxID=210409 RepID=A0A5B7F5K3_PORTR|nr:hypothetical protein [Portunus trituberculatus]
MVVIGQRGGRVAAVLAAAPFAGRVGYFFVVTASKPSKRSFLVRLKASTRGTKCKFNPRNM